MNYLFFSQGYKDLHCMQIFKELGFLFCFVLIRISTSSFFSPPYSFPQCTLLKLQTVFLESPLAPPQNCLALSAQCSVHCLLGFGFPWYGVQRHRSISPLGSGCEFERARSQQCTRCDLMESWEPAVTGYEMSLLC